jgi:hypothetical protein
VQTKSSSPFFQILWDGCGIESRLGSNSISPEVTILSDAPKMIEFWQIAAMQTVKDAFLL